MPDCGMRPASLSPPSRSGRASPHHASSAPSKRYGSYGATGSRSFVRSRNDRQLLPTTHVDTATMTEELVIATTGDKKEKYNILLPQLESLVAGESDITANLANIAAALKETFDFFWVGFYL